MGTEIERTGAKRLIGSGRTVYPLATFTVGGRTYVRVLIPYTALERRQARRPTRAHIETVREDRLSRGSGPEGDHG